MRILEKVEDSSQIIAKRNICNVFDTQRIEEELSRYSIDINFSAPRSYNKDLWVMYVTSPYVGNARNLLHTPAPTTVALFVNYDTESAFAMPRKGSDKPSLLLIASVCNKHINEPFKLDSNIRYELFQQEDK